MGDVCKEKGSQNKRTHATSGVWYSMVWCVTFQLTSFNVTDDRSLVVPRQLTLHHSQQRLVILAAMSRERCSPMQSDTIS